MTSAQQLVLVLGIALIVLAMIRWWGPELHSLV